MKKLGIGLMTALLLIGLIACSNDTAATEPPVTPEGTEGEGTEPQESAALNVGVAFFPMKEILTLIQDDLKAEGIDLTISEFSDYQTPNNLLKDGELDANMIQHEYFLQSFNEANNTDLVIVQPIYHAIYSLYAREYDSVDAIPEGASITLPDDATNLSRALYLLGQAELLTFKEGKTVGLTLEDIEENPKNLDLTDQVPLTSLAQRYTETGLAVMYPTYAQSLELKGDEQRIFTEFQDDVTKNYAISLAARSDNQDSPAIKKLQELLQSDKVKQFLLDEYGWASTPAW